MIQVMAWYSVANTDSDTVSVINTSTNTVVATIPVGTGTYLEHDAPIGVAYDSLNSAVYVTNGRFNTVSVINTSTNKVIYTIYNAIQSNPVELVGPAAIAYDSDNHEMYVGEFWF